MKILPQDVKQHLINLSQRFTWLLEKLRTHIATIKSTMIIFVVNNHLSHSHVTVTEPATRDAEQVQRGVMVDAVTNWRQAQLQCVEEGKVSTVWHHGP